MNTVIAIRDILTPFTPEEELHNQIHECYLPISANRENRAKYHPGPKHVVYANYYYIAMTDFFTGDYSTGLKDLMYCINMYIFESIYDMEFMYNYMKNNGYSYKEPGEPIKVV